MFTDNKTRDLAKTALEIMERKFQNDEQPQPEPTQLAESTEATDLQELTTLIDDLLVEGIAQYIGLMEEEMERQLSDDEINEVTNAIIEDIHNLDDQSKAMLGESLIEAHNQNLL